MKPRGVFAWARRLLSPGGGDAALTLETAAPDEALVLDAPLGLRGVLSLTGRLAGRSLGRLQLRVDGQTFVARVGEGNAFDCAVRFLRPGARRVRFTAWLDDGTVRRGRAASRLMVAPLRVHLDEPNPWRGAAGEHVYLAGWCVSHARGGAYDAIAEVRLDIDGQVSGCVFPMDRPDVARAYPKVRDAARSGFAAEAFLTRPGERRVRLALTLAGGRTLTLRPVGPLPVAGGRIGQAVASADGVRTERPGLNCLGYFRHALGLGVSARACARAALADGTPLALRPLWSNLHAVIAPEDERPFVPYYAENPRHDATMIIAGPGEIETGLIGRTPWLRRDRRLIAAVWWEFPDHFPYASLFDRVDQVAAFTAFSAEAARRAAPPGYPVVALPYPFEPPRVEADRRAVRRRFRLPEESFVVFFAFDVLSAVTRKNPEGLVRTFAQALGRAADARLALKVAHASAAPDVLAGLVGLADDLGVADRLVVIDEFLSRADMSALTASADCYASLHRSEGLGLGLAEAMSLGVPALATAYGGNLEFMTPDNSLLVDYRLTELARDDGPYRRGWRWAEPALEDAAHKLRRLYEDADWRRTLAARGPEGVAKALGPARFARSLRALLE